jgi:hypothetical protein
MTPLLGYQEFPSVVIELQRNWMSESHDLFTKESVTHNEINSALHAKYMGVKPPGRIQPTHVPFKKDSAGCKQKRGEYLQLHIS